MSTARNPLSLLAAPLVAPLVATVAWLPISADAGAQQAPPATAVRALSVEAQLLQERRQVTGELRAIARAQVATNEGGLVMELPVTDGQLVRTGDVLAVLDKRRLAIELEQVVARQLVAKSIVAAREAELALKVSDLEALRTLNASRASNPKEVADAVSEHAIAVARRDEAQQDLDVLEAVASLLRTRIDDKTVRAPFDGVVVRRHTERGEWRDRGDPIAEIVSIGAYEAWLDVPQRYAEALRTGSADVQIRIDATGTDVPPAHPTIVPLVDPTARTFSAYLRVEDTRGILAPGMSLTAWVPTGAEEMHLTVPRDAMLRNAAGFYVYAARANPGGPMRAVPVAIDIEFETTDRVAIRRGGLTEGDLVVVEGNERLFPMMMIRIDAGDTAGGAAEGPAQGQ